MSWKYKYGEMTTESQQWWTKKELNFVRLGNFEPTQLQPFPALGLYLRF